tara:strand:+ start:136 stop:312 length:177 start_codon:yes stop_codon:yes gene_type:complete
MNVTAYCIECGKQITEKPIFGEYPEEGEILCSNNCMGLYEARGLEADKHAEAWRKANP